MSVRSAAYPGAMGYSNGRVRRFKHDLRFLHWDARVRAESLDQNLVERVRTRCPRLPDLSNTPDAAVGFSLSLVVGSLLRIGLPVGVAITTRSLAAIGVAMVVGRVAFRVGDSLLLRRADRHQRSGWQQLDPRRMRFAARAQEAACCVSSLTLRGATVSFILGVVLGLFVIAGHAIGDAGSSAVAAVAAFSTLAMLVCILLVVLMLCALLCEMLVPTFLGPSSRSAHLISRSDMEALRPLLRVGPVRLARDAWDLFRALRV